MRSQWALAGNWRCRGGRRRCGRWSRRWGSCCWRGCRWWSRRWSSWGWCCGGSHAAVEKTKCVRSDQTDTYQAYSQDRDGFSTHSRSGLRSPFKPYKNFLLGDAEGRDAQRVSQIEFLSRRGHCLSSRTPMEAARAHLQDLTPSLVSVHCPRDPGACPTSLAMSILSASAWTDLSSTSSILSVSPFRSPMLLDLPYKRICRNGEFLPSSFTTHLDRCSQPFFGLAYGSGEERSNHAGLGQSIKNYDRLEHL